MFIQNIPPRNGTNNIIEEIKNESIEFIIISNK